LSAGIDFSWDRDKRSLFMCIVLFRSRNVVDSVYSYLVHSVREFKLHFRRLTRKKKRILLSAVRRLLGGAVKQFSRDDVFVFKAYVPKFANLMSKYSWLESKACEIIGIIRRYRNYPHQVVVGSDLERGKYSFSENLRRRLGINVYIDDRSQEVCIADAIVNYARIEGKIPIKHHFC